MTSLSQQIADLIAFDGGRGADALCDASMAAAALVAMADGDVSFAERAMLDQALDALAARGAVDLHAAVAAFEDFVEAIRANTSQGRRLALAALQGAAEAAPVILRVANAVAAADGGPSKAERAVVAEIEAALASGGREA